jgi:hypothetical protein
MDKNMHKYKKAAISIAFLTVIFSSGLSAGYIDNDRDKGQNKRNLSRQEAILEAFENNDYQSWKKVVAKQGKIAKVVNERDFKKFIEARYAARSGNYKQAIRIAKDLEISLKNKMGQNLLA